VCLTILAEALVNFKGDYKMSKIILRAALIGLTLAVSNLAHASGAVEYTCAGFIPSGTPGGQLTQESIVFNMTSANHAIDIEIVSKSQSDVDPAGKFLSVDKDCKFTMEPAAGYPAYRVSVLGKCGTKIGQNFKGVCFFNF
jgi:hypothetical protein